MYRIDNVYERHIYINVLIYIGICNIHICIREAYHVHRLEGLGS